MTEKLLRELESGTKTAMLKKRIVNYYIVNGNSTIAELAKALDVSIPTTTKIVEEMTNNGFINTYGKLETSEGRHPLLYGLNPASGYFVGVDLNHGYVNLGLIDFKGELVEHEMKIPYAYTNSYEGLDALCAIISSFIDSLDIDRKKIINVNVNISGRVNPESGCSYSLFNLSEEPLTQLISQRLSGLRVTIDNDTRAMAYGEYICGQLSHKRNMLYINVSWGIGLGIIIDGKIHAGSTGFAGEFGHYPVYDNEIICHCGKKGCLETEASGKAVHRQLLERIDRGEASTVKKKVLENRDQVDLNAIIEAVRNEDELCIELVDELGKKLGKQIAGLINIFNPEDVIIGGIMSCTGDIILEPIKSYVRRHSLSMVHRNTNISVSRLQEKAGMIGACMLARSRVFDTPQSTCRHRN